MREQTKILHSIPVDPLTGAISVPIYQTSTFVQESPGVHRGFDYSRTSNPTRKALEKIAANLEEGTNGYAFASGLAAIDAVIKLLKQGDEIITVDDIYGGAYRLLSKVYSRFGILTRSVDMCDPQNVRDAITSKTRMIWIETPTNPTLKIADIEAIAQIAKSAGCLLVVDNTFATPLSQKPILLGADIVVHSATKYLSGHSDLIAGLVITANQALGEQIQFIQNASGAILGPFDSWLVIRGIETLDLRFRQHSQSALLIAKYLQSCDFVANVYHPGLENHRNYQVSKKQSRYSGGIVSFDLKTDKSEDAKLIVCSTKLFHLAESLGGPKSLICQPSEMTHKSIPRETRYNAGVTDSLIRLSVGLEAHEDLITDLQTVFEKSFSYVELNTLES